MKRWTVMLIPNDAGKTRTLNLAAYQPILLLSLVIFLLFSTTFLFKRHQTTALQAAQWQQRAESLDIERINADQNARQQLTQEERIEIEHTVRTEYEASVAAITAELGELYEIEAKARELTGFAPRTPVNVQPLSGIGNGKGGGALDTDAAAPEPDDFLSRPPEIIYGLSRPSADLIIQEINLRTASLHELVADLHAERNRIERMPSIWPTLSPNRRISSSYGYRKDPFTNRVRHHSGTDIVAPFRSQVVATAKGIVKSAGQERYLGKVVKIDHGNGMETCYAHLDSYCVQAGQEVKRFDPIGKLGNTGRSTGAHLHYEVHVNGKVVNSGKYLKD